MIDGIWPYNVIANLKHQYRIEKIYFLFVDAYCCQSATVIVATETAVATVATLTLWNN
jgi:hypothetical protein